MLIDEEVREIIERASANASQLLKDNIDKLHVLANTLLERETLDGDDMDRVLRGETLEPVQRGDSPGPSAEAPVNPPVSTPDEGGAQLDAFGGPAPRPAGA